MGGAAADKPTSNASVVETLHPHTRHGLMEDRSRDQNVGSLHSSIATSMKDGTLLISHHDRQCLKSPMAVL
jgi:hypothetical protein